MPARLRRTLLVGGGSLFWGYFLARWVNDWLLPAGVLVPAEESFLPAATLAGLPTWLRVVAELLPKVAPGAWLTLWLTVGAIALGFPIAVGTSVLRVYGGRARYLAYGFTELIRGTPLLAQLFVLYYGTGLTSVVRNLPLVGVGPIPEQAVFVALLGFTINSAAYQSEYIRAAIESVDAGQLTAARAVGLSRLAGIRLVVLPQALRYAIPGWSNELVYLIKYSSLATFITVPELFHRGEEVASSNFRFTLVFGVLGLIYLGIVVTAAHVTGRLEKRTAIPGLGADGEGRGH